MITSWACLSKASFQPTPWLAGGFFLLEHVRVGEISSNAVFSRPETSPSSFDNPVVSPTGDHT